MKVMDNFFTSSMLFENYLDRKFYVIRTTRQGQSGFKSGPPREWYAWGVGD